MRPNRCSPDVGDECVPLKPPHQTPLGTEYQEETDFYAGRKSLGHSPDQHRCS